MTYYKKLAENPLAHFDYFVEWGRWPWRRFVRLALDDFIGYDLTGLDVLDIGTRSGRMTCLFALLGARAVGIDKSPGFDAFARAEAARLGVAGRTEFIATDGSLDAVAGRTFDLVFTKSLLVLVPDFADFVSQIDGFLNPGGRVCFVENGYGNFLVNAIRPFRHNWDWRLAKYFTRREIKMLGNVFETISIRYWPIPPIYLYCGRKRP